MNSSASPSSRPLSVGLLSPGWPVGAMANGIVSYTATLARAMPAAGATPHVFTANIATETPESFVHGFRPDNRSLRAKITRRLRPRGWSRRAYCDALLRELRAFLAREPLDLLELEETFGWAAPLKGRSPVPLIVRLHGPWFLNGAANGVAADAAFAERDAWERDGLLAADAITSPSADVLRQTREHFQLELPGAAVIPNPVDPVPEADRWKPAECDPRRIAFIGRFDRHKGGDLALDAFAKVLREFPDAVLEFAGPDRGCADESGRSWSIDRYLEMKLTPAERARVTVHGFVPGPQAARLRKQALVTIAPSRYETFGIAAAEAMAAGCPLVVGGAGALTELVQDRRNGLVARAGDADDLAERIVALLRNPALAADLGRQAALDAAERYAPDVVARRTIEFYRTVVGPAARMTATA